MRYKTFGPWNPGIVFDVPSKYKTCPDPVSLKHRPEQLASMTSIVFLYLVHRSERLNFDTRGFNTGEAVLFCGHNVSLRQNYDMLLRQNDSSTSPRISRILESALKS